MINIKIIFLVCYFSGPLFKVKKLKMIIKIYVKYK